MQIKFGHEALEKIKSDIVVALATQKTKGKDDKGIAVLQKSDGGIALDKALGGLISKIIAEEKFRGETASFRIIYSQGRIPAKMILLMGLGKTDEFSNDVLRKIGAKIASVANDFKAKNVAGLIQPESIKGLQPYSRIQALVEGFILGSYKFEQYKDKKDIEPDAFSESIFVFKGNPAAQQKIRTAIDRALLTADGVNMVRDLVNMPPKDLTPDALAKKAKEVASAAKLGCKILGPKEIKEEKMGLLLAVAKGSEHEPRFIHLSYRPSKKAKKKIALVGKGVTFDSGGYDLKPSKHMLAMKNDMAGAATCIAVMKIISALKSEIEIDAYMPATDNMIDAKAEVPGNIIKSRRGKTVEISNTDAEGRLILADAIDYALERKPDYIIDIATLTGGVLYALGEIYTAVLGNDQKLIEKYIKAANETNEPAWNLPLVKEYKKGFFGGPADISNVSKTFASTISGALFIEEFVKDTKWLHLDIAESAWAEEERAYTPKGGTGGTVR
ncbi:MAG: leucyl aminopeptidase, partial [Deltaproteobacteria bacterium]|nr:leucyl aminopeptidase [Deltaproteobacteria bacterium]